MKTRTELFNKAIFITKLRYLYFHFNRTNTIVKSLAVENQGFLIMASLNWQTLLFIICWN